MSENKEQPKAAGTPPINPPTPPAPPAGGAELPPNDGANAWPFGGDKVIAGTMHYNVEAREAVRWFYEVCREDELGMKDSAKLIRYDSSTLYRVCLGKYEGNIKNVTKAIQAYREIWNERQSVRRAGFVETSISKDVWRICRNSLKYNAMGLIVGTSQVGKTTALLEYQRLNNHGKTKYLRLPASAGVQLVAKEFATACRLSRDCPFETLRERVMKAIDSNHLVIIDEIHQAFATYQKGARMKVIEFIREIYDRTQCGMVLCGTPVFEKEMEEGNLKELLEQLNRRCLFRLHLPAPEKLPKADLVRIAAAFGLTAPNEEQEEQIRDLLRVSGLGMFFKFLQASSELATNENMDLNWDVFTRASDIINKRRPHK